MPKTIRGKFICESMHRNRYSTDQTDYIFEACDEAEWSAYTPAGEIKMSVTNPEVSFELGKTYYVDLTPAEED